MYDFFSKQLISWNSAINKRNMPWKGEKDPYKIWLSEIILQQTRVEQGLEFYKKFIFHFPSVSDLAQTPDTEIFKLWEGLGYYTRCKNLIITARHIAIDKKGIFPDTYAEILALKGIGPYTAAAIASFAYNLPHAVVDGNVFRVLSRFFSISTPIDSTAGKKIFASLANELLDKKQPASYNQAIMDFGATVCKPKIPLCSSCILQTQCVAYKKGIVQLLPVKEKSIIKRNRYFYYFIITYNSKIYVYKRKENDIWENLYEFILVEKTSPVTIDINSMARLLTDTIDTKKFKITGITKVYKQQLTHQTIYAQFIQVDLFTVLSNPAYDLIGKEEIKKLPFPKLITSYFKDHPLFKI
ncbi:MAG: A/G-specific adenine glycosylase [Chitinophagaceae bacterium]|nr:A/G-specific adenine glycosylase [Chitinophagaceae bacterium]